MNFIINDLYFYLSFYICLNTLMFNFLMKPELLPLSKTANVQHFYEFQGKQIHEK